MKTRFWKLSGAGNDFVLLEGLPKGRSGAALARALCGRREGVGADGLIAMSRRGGKVRLDYWNSDGSAAFCGNGTRCGVLWAAERGWLKGKELSIQTARGPVLARRTAKGRVETTMPAPANLRLGIRIKTEGYSLQAHYVDTGVPHAVVFVPEASRVDVKGLGRALRMHKAFGRAGANVDFVEIQKNNLVVRTYERGVEGETLACGTGVMAAAFIARVLGFGEMPLRVRVASGDALSVSFRDGPRLEGPARIVFSGEVSL